MTYRSRVKGLISRMVDQVGIKRSAEKPGSGKGHAEDWLEEMLTPCVRSMMMFWGMDRFNGGPR